MGVNEKVLQLHAIYKKLFLQVTQESVSVLQDTQNPYQVLPVTRAVSEHAIKLKVCMIKPLSSLAPSYAGKKYHSIVAIGIVTRAVHS